MRKHSGQICYSAGFAGIHYRKAHPAPQVVKLNPARLPESAKPYIGLSTYPASTFCAMEKRLPITKIYPVLICMPSPPLSAKLLRNFVSGSKVTGAMNPAIPDSVESHGFSLSARIRHFPDADANRLPPRAGLGYSRIRWRRILCTDWLLGRIGRLGPRCAPERLPDRFHLARKVHMRSTVLRRTI